MFRCLGQEPLGCRGCIRLGDKNTDAYLKRVQPSLTGTGPFVFKKWKKGDFIRLERNPNCWNKDKSHLDAIIVRITPTVPPRAAALERGEVQAGRVQLRAHHQR